MRQAVYLWLPLPAMLLLGAGPLAAPAADHVYKKTVGHCLLEAEGYSYTLAPCEYYYYYNAVTGHSLHFAQKRPRNYFVRFGSVDFDDPTRRTGEGSWNGPTISNLHGDHFLGKMHRTRNCWLNKGARFCFWPMPSLR